ncbi:superinfection immunity protein [Marichromatium sp. AB31]|nr:superinfection immunity protein [Marichromatium sp. AB31]
MTSKDAVTWVCQSCGAENTGRPKYTPKPVRRQGPKKSTSKLPPGHVVWLSIAGVVALSVVVSSAQPADAPIFTAIAGVAYILAFGAAAFAVYFLPAIVAKIRRHSKIEALIALNLLLGWTFFGWAAALVWAFMEDNQPRAASSNSGAG